jgi:Holliday junction DNA helicase RuvA
VIARLRGLLLEKEPPHLVVEAGGVGYGVEAPMSTFYRLPHTGEAVDLRIHTVVREDAFLLYGFATRAEQDMFAALLKVSGVGARLALAALSALSPEELWHSVDAGDTQRLSRIPGVGKKTAERLVVELRERLQPPEGLTAMAGATGGGGAAVAGAAARGPEGEAQAALEELGYGGDQARSAVAAVAAEGMGVEDLLKQALQQLAR